jgi:hypothetical protein
VTRLVSISREDAEAGDSDESAASVQRLLADRAFARSLQGGIVIAFDGWDDDPRDITRIPAVLRYLRQLHEAVPFLFYFLDPAPEHGALMHFAAAHGGLVRSAQDPEQRVVVEQTQESAAALATHLAGAYALAERLADDPAQIVRALVEPYDGLAEALSELA